MTNRRYRSPSEALNVARQNRPARQELGRRGWGHAVAAEVWNVDGQFEILSITVRPEVAVIEPHHQTI